MKQILYFILIAAGCGAIWAMPIMLMFGNETGAVVFVLFSGIAFLIQTSAASGKGGRVYGRWLE